ncbi:hypothetical protein RSAG8_06931, partial [Rhizoctonia solani AG-8 WAC10335]
MVSSLMPSAAYLTLQVVPTRQSHCATCGGLSLELLAKRTVFAGSAIRRRTAPTSPPASAGRALNYGCHRKNL